MLGGQCNRRSKATVRAYKTDILQFIAFLHENNVAVSQVLDVGKVDVLEYLAELGRRGLTGVARARKISALREYFRFFERPGSIQKSPTAGIDTPKREKHTRQYLRSEEFTKMLSLAGASPRDYAILQVFLQTGIRVSKLSTRRRGPYPVDEPGHALLKRMGHPGIPLAQIHTLAAAGASFAELLGAHRTEDVLQFPLVGRIS